MTIYELKLAFQDAVDKVSTAASPVLTIQQEERVLNYATERFIKQRYGGINTKQTGFEVTQKRTDDLSTLVKYVSLPSAGPAPVFETTVQYELPLDYWFSLREEVELISNECGVETVKKVAVEARQLNQINSLLNDPFNKPGNTSVFRTMAYNSIVVYKDPTTTLGNLNLAYLASFQKLKVNVNYKVRDNETKDDPLYYQRVEFWMPEHTHLEIANIAAQIYLEQVADPRYQTIINENLTQE